MMATQAGTASGSEECSQTLSGSGSQPAVTLESTLKCQDSDSEAAAQASCIVTRKRPCPSLPVTTRPGDASGPRANLNLKPRGPGELGGQGSSRGSRRGRLSLSLSLTVTGSGSGSERKGKRRPAGT
eukprot:1394131-Rhodomonas_salina.1